MDFTIKLENLKLVADMVGKQVYFVSVCKVYLMCYLGEMCSLQRDRGTDWSEGG